MMSQETRHRASDVIYPHSRAKIGFVKKLRFPRIVIDSRSTKWCFIPGTTRSQIYARSFSLNETFLLIAVYSWKEKKRNRRRVSRCRYVHTHRLFSTCFRRRGSLDSLSAPLPLSLPTIGRHKSRTRWKKRLFRARPFERVEWDGAKREKGRQREKQRESEDVGSTTRSSCFAVVDISVLSVLVPSLSLSLPFSLLSLGFFSLFFSFI